MGVRDQVAAVAEVNSVGMDRGGSTALRCRHRRAPRVLAGAGATSLLGGRRVSQSLICGGSATAIGASYGQSVRSVVNMCWPSGPGRLLVPRARESPASCRASAEKCEGAPGWLAPLAADRGPSPPRGSRLPAISRGELQADVYNRSGL